MIASVELLRSCARLILHLAGARSISVFLPGSPSSDFDTILIHEGGLPPIAELASEEAAEALCRGDGHRPANLDDPVTSPRTLGAPGADADSRLIRISRTQASPHKRQASARPTRRESDGSPGDPSSDVWVGIRFQAGPVDRAEEGGRARGEPEETARWSHPPGLGRSRRPHHEATRTGGVPDPPEPCDGPVPGAGTGARVAVHQPG
jgi:hypothetical protein